MTPIELSAASREERAAHWCILFATGALSVEEQCGYDDWIAADPANAAAFDEALAVWRSLDAVRDTPEILNRRARSLDSLRRANRDRWSSGFRSHWRTAVGLAAALAVVIAVSLWNTAAAPIQYATAIGERRVVVLADGSRLSLDAQTTVVVNFADTLRLLTLVEGRAKFDVAHLASRPFLVTAGDRTVVARGTVFSVESVGKDVQVILYEGKVEVVAGPAPLLAQLQLPGAIKGAVVLAPGEQLTARPGEAARVGAADAAATLGWESGQLNFENEPLPSAVERLNRYSTAKLIIGDARAAAIRIDGVFNAGDQAAFADALGATYPVHIAPNGNNLVISSTRR